MKMLETMLSAGGGAVVEQPASQFGLDADQAPSLAGPAALELGTSLVSKILGSGDLTKVASTVAEKTGVSGTIISNMLPIRATLLGGVLAKSTAAGNNLTDVVGQIANEGPGRLLGTLKNVTRKMTG